MAQRSSVGRNVKPFRGEKKGPPPKTSLPEEDRNCEGREQESVEKNNQIERCFENTKDGNIQWLLIHVKIPTKIVKTNLRPGIVIPSAISQ